VAYFEPLGDSTQSISASVGRLYKGLVPPLLLEAPKRATKCVWLQASHVNTGRDTHLPYLVAANDFWGKTYRQLNGSKEMTQSLSILTGCSAGATESFVVRDWVVDPKCT
jgi:solute carrier family 25 2-oxodicarboxylate transporter 21